MNLDVRLRFLRSGPEKSLGFSGRGDRSLTGAEELRKEANLLPQALGRVIGWHRGAKGRSNKRMLHEVLADTPAFELRLDAEWDKLAWITDPRQHKDLRRVYRATAQDNALRTRAAKSTRAIKNDVADLSFLDDELMDVSARQQFQILASQSWLENDVG